MLRLAAILAGVFVAVSNAHHALAVLCRYVLALITFDGCDPETVARELDRAFAGADRSDG